jgi:hypothetical protein
MKGRAAEAAALHMAIPKRISDLTREDLIAFVGEYAAEMTEEEALAVLGNRFVTPQVCAKIAQTQRLAAYYSVRLKLVAHRQTPQAHAAKLVHYLYWTDLVRLSVEVTVPPTVRRAIDNQLLARVGELTAGERVSSARRCSAALIKALLFDQDPRVFAALLVNQRVREEDLLYYASSPKAGPAQLEVLAADPKWSFRYSIRKALAANPLTPRAVAAAQLRHLSADDLRKIHSHPDTSVYVRRCIERLAIHESSSASQRRID